MDGKFKFIANCAVQFNSIVSGWVRERCRMCDQNSAEFSSGGDFSSETKRFFPPELSLSSKVTLLLYTTFVPPRLINGSNALLSSVKEIYILQFLSIFSDS